MHCLSGYLPKFNKGLVKVSGEHFQHFSMEIFLIEPLPIDQVSILDLFYFSRYSTIFAFKFLGKKCRERKAQKLEYLKNEQSLLGKLESIFQNFLSNFFGEIYVEVTSFNLKKNSTTFAKKCTTTSKKRSQSEKNKLKTTTTQEFLVHILLISKRWKTELTMTPVGGLKQISIENPERRNPFVSNSPFHYTLKTSENRKVFWCFQGVEKGCIGNKWVKSCLLFSQNASS